MNPKPLTLPDWLTWWKT